MPKKIKNNSPIFYGVDFHVHTPASTCYKSTEKNEEDEYLALLRRYIEQDVKVISLTDHNTIKGYKKYLEIKSNLVNKLTVLNDFIDEHKALKEQYKIIEKNLNLFGKISILPGVEIEVNPGVHLLLVFNPNSNLNKIEDFLIELGYTDEYQGLENPGILTSLDINQVLERVPFLDCVSIAAHVDSDKGIYNILSGTYRTFVFRSCYLNAVSYNSPKTCEKMKSMISNREYARTKPLAFIQSSDYHGGHDVNLKVTFLKLKEFTFESVCAALNNPDECISPTKNPEIVNVIKQFINSPNIVAFESYEGVSQHYEIKKSACALLNEGYGSIIFGVLLKSHQNILGTNISNEQVDLIIKTILESFTFISINKIIYPYNNRSVLIVAIQSASQLYYLKEDNEAYILKDKQVVKASPLDIQSLTENKIYSRVLKQQTINQDRIDSLIKELTILKDSTQYYSVIRKIEKNSVTINTIVNLGFASPYYGKSVLLEGNGNVEGEVFYVDESDPRLIDAYLRMSCPRSNQYKTDDFKIHTHTSPAIVIVPGGGSYFVNNDSKDWGIVCLTKENPALVLSLNQTMQEIFSELALVAWLKSSLFLWYSDIVLGDINIYLPSIFMDIPIPFIDLLKPAGQIEELAIHILKLESELLQKTTNTKIDKKALNELVVKHNKSVEKIAYKIDELFFEWFEISKSQEEMIIRFFEHKRIYNVIPKDKRVANIQVAASSMQEKSTKKQNPASTK